MGFGDLKSRSGLETLNKYLEDKSYIEGYVHFVCPLLPYNIYLSEGKPSTPRAGKIFMLLKEDQQLICKLL